MIMKFWHLWMSKKKKNQQCNIKLKLFLSLRPDKWLIEKSQTPVFNFSHFFLRECFENSWAGFLWCFILHSFITLPSLFSSPFAVRTTGCTWKCWGMQEHTSTPSPADSDRSEGLDGDGWFGDWSLCWFSAWWWSCFLFVGFFFF